MGYKFFDVACITALVSFGMGNGFFVNAMEAKPASEAIEHIQTGSPYVLDKIYPSVVKIEAAKLNPDYASPWSLGNFSSGTGTGFLIGKNQFLTNAHVVSNAQRLSIVQSGDPKKYPARVKFVAHDADLALLEVEDFTPFEKLPVLELADLPKLEDEVRVIGYPVGGDRLSITRGVVSRIDFRPYSHSGVDSHLVIQIDAAINPGNSGGPVMLGDKVIGVAFQGLRNADNTGYMIPMPVVKRFLHDIEDGNYGGYVDLGISVFPIYNQAMREKLRLPDDGMGILVSEITKGSVTENILQPGDVLVAVDGNPVDSAGMVQFGNQKINMNELTERKLSGDKVKLAWLHDGKRSEAEVVATPLPATQLMRSAYGKKPRYVLMGGLLFQPLSRDVILANRLASSDIIPELEDFIQNGGWLKKKDCVVLTRVLSDEINSGIPDFVGGIVQKVNGNEVNSLEDLLKFIADPKGGEFIEISIKNAARPILLKRSMLNAANDRIKKSYQIERSFNL